MEETIVFAIGSDHAGFELKEQLKQVIRSYGFDYHDFGTYSEQSVDYPDYAIQVCRSLVNEQYKYGILICGTGNGMAMAANKFSGIRAALSWKPEIAALARQHNDANILVLPARHLSITEASAIVHAFTTSNFEGGRHEGRVKKMSNAAHPESKT